MNYRHTRENKTLPTDKTELIKNISTHTFSKGVIKDSKKIATIVAVLAAIGTSFSTVDASTVYGTGAQAHPSSSAYGENAKATGSNTAAFGWNTEATQAGAVAYGYNTKAKGTFSSAFGFQANATGNNATALGTEASAAGTSATATGDGASAKGNVSSAYGWLAKATGVSSSAYGESSHATAEFSSAYGSGSVASGSGASAYGTSAIANSTYAVAVGGEAQATNQNAVAIGYDAWAQGKNSLSAGSSAKAYNEGSIALGNKATSGDVNSIAIGTNARSNQTNSVALGSDSVTGNLHYDETAKTVSFDGGITIYNYAGLATYRGGSVSVGAAGSERQIQNVAAGNITSKSTDAVNGSQLYATNQAVSTNTTNITNLKSLIDQVSQGWTSQIDGENVQTVKSGSNQNFESGSNIILTNDNGAIKVSTKDDVTFNTVTLDTLSVGNTVTINSQGIDAGNTKITNVTDGEVSATSKDAVNGSQLYATNQSIENVKNNVNNIEHQVSNLDNRVDKVAAGAAALAALHPLDFDPDDKWDFAAGYGNYRSANAAAIGLFYRPNEDTMFSIGGSFGGGENMVNAGLSIKLGQGNHVSTSKIAMAKEIKDLRTEVEALKSALLDQNAGHKIDTTKLQLFPDVPANHWAYEDVAVLAGNGVIKGYTDGTFGGDRAMTRYEFASMLYRAMLNGAKLSDKMLNEFAPELERFTVDTVHSDNNGKATIERVRTVKEKKN
ncbi:MAG: S-layer homology domain-containing protein [Megasphaera sp.]|jgi:autotransporter adhesin|nr:S-layer homology domain-containing protein [Megasphaera sp.]